ncbi:MAG: conjugal transfer protein TraF, partial [Nitrospirota bacterium]|nr:conjugal transfer protein TraF [Nitrospirota bacterium]
IELIQDAQDIDMNDTGEVTDLLRKYMGEHQHLRTALFPHVGFNVAGAGVMIGGLGQGTVDVEIRNPVWPETHVDIIADGGVLAGAGLKLPVTGLSAGVVAKYIYRKSLTEVYTASDIAAADFEDRLDEDLKSGSGISADIGLMYDLPFVPMFDTTVALVAQNIPEINMGNARDIKTQFNAGISLTKSFAAFAVLLALDYRDITNNIGEDSDVPKRIHMGAEVKLPKILAVRVGLNQGYLTAGATVDFWVLRFDFATYGEEMGAYAGQREDRRYIGQITLGW